MDFYIMELFENGADAWESFKRDMENDPYGDEMPTDAKMLELAFYARLMYS